MREAQRDAVLIELVDRLRKYGSWCGETHVQKAVYFLQEMFGVPLGLSFILYKHGPFSFDLRDELGNLRTRQLLEVAPTYPYGSRIEVADKGEDHRRRFPVTIGRFKDRIEEIAERLGSCNVDDLERLSTALYVMKSGKGPDEIVRLKPHVKKEMARDAYRRVREWKKAIEG